MSKRTATAPTIELTANASVLMLAFELGEASWLLGFSAGFGGKVLRRKIGSRDTAALMREITRAKRQLGLADEAPVRSCYEAGRDGFWLHRFLASEGVENLVIDSASIEVNRRKRRAKTDRLDLGGLIDLRERKALLRSEDAGESVKKVWRLLHLRGVGIESAWCYGMEFFGWREFRNRKQVGSLAGLTPTPHDSGKSERERGIGKDGSRWVRGVAIEQAWAWLRFQPESELSRWYHARFGSGSKRLRKIGIVALARKLLIALWRFVEFGLVPEGAVVTPQVRLP